ncbi:hypothetical protein DNTS_014809 [Danionella cerebrum]|uniref:B box-type domain-containing protein n=1 Tax=Danionella cerebrum TaxID=2873325 RepID=A0A553QUC6_9TELE|nr:hypothetical protein DNTS_014809 [Danionella translucida]
METVTLDQHATEMESRLEELRQRMNQEKEEREKIGASHWHSGQPGNLTPSFQNVKKNKENTISPGKMKIRVLKEDSASASQKPLSAEVVAKNSPVSKKLKLKGKVCGQCEVQSAGVMCVECGEDYCVGCFVRFHQRGALKRHQMVPLQAELQTPISSRDVLGRLHQQVQAEENPKPTEEEERSAPRSAPSMNQTHRPQVVFINYDGVVEKKEENGNEVENNGSLLRGAFDEDQSARSFQEALKEWRECGQRPGSAERPQ